MTLLEFQEGAAIVQASNGGQAMGAAPYLGLPAPAIAWTQNFV